MMGKVNIDKTNGHAPVRTERHADVKPTKDAPVRPASVVTKDNGDQIRVSGKAAEFSKLVSKLKELPDVRMDRVADVRARVQSGSFQPSSGEIADAILNDERS
jgi:flagellar biosynthesis anti-sigma factor FlgM